MNSSFSEWPDRLYHGFKTLCVLDALDILCYSLKSDETKIRLSEEVLPVSVSVLYCDKEIFDLPAKSFYLVWYGGPPDRGRWYKASLLALVIDRCLYAMVRGWTAQVCNAIKQAELYGSFSTPLENRT